MAKVKAAGFTYHFDLVMHDIYVDGVYLPIVFFGFEGVVDTAAALVEMGISADRIQVCTQWQ